MVLHDLQTWQSKLKIGSALAQEFYKQNEALLTKQYASLAFLGMGGSGIAGKIIKSLFAHKGGIRVDIYHAPCADSYVDQRTLAFVITYSGNTWETLEALKDLLEKGITPIVVTRGGRALQIAQGKGLPYVLLPEAISPRSALGYFLGFFLELFNVMELLDGRAILQQWDKHCERYLSSYGKQETFNEFIQAIADREFFHIWGIGADSGAYAYRAQTQFNENSKVQAVYTEFPEVCHNLIVGFTSLKSQPLVLFYHTDFISDYLKRAITATEELLRESGVGLYKPPIFGDTFHEQLFNIILWSDFASYFLGVARGVEINPVRLIDNLKQKHKEQGIEV